MGLQTILFVICLSLAPTADNRRKSKKGIGSQSKNNHGRSTKLEKAGQLAEARSRYSESQALTEVKDVTEALKRLDEEIRRRAKVTLNDARKLYDSQKYREAADALPSHQLRRMFPPPVGIAASIARTNRLTSYER
jgi:flagellar motility protein MotE (MotC chaperone)